MLSFLDSTSSILREIMEFFFLYIFFFFSLAQAQCFWSNGTDRNILYWREGPNYQKCSNSTSDGNSMCCRTWGPGDFTLDVCEGSFCRNGRTEALWRESCSDPTWESDSCIKLCTDDTGEFAVMFNRKQEVHVLMYNKNRQGHRCHAH